MTTTTIKPAPTTIDGLPQNAAALRGNESLEGVAANAKAEPKLDGWRLLVHIAEEGVRLYTRTGKRHDGSLPSIEAELGENLPAGTWLDCEAVALEVAEGKVLQTWGTVQSILGSSTAKAAAASDKITLMAFDLIAHGGIDARPLPYAQRRELLEGVIGGADWNRVQIVPQVEPTQGSLDALLAQGFEGMMVKRLDAPYASGKRGHGWTKIKPTLDADVVITGYTEGKNGFAGMIGAVTFGLHDEAGELQPAGKCSGMDMKMRQAFTQQGGELVGKVMEIKYQERMPTGGLRSPNFVRMRPDKAPTDCTWEAVGV